MTRLTVAGKVVLAVECRRTTSNSSSTQFHLLHKERMLSDAGLAANARSRSGFCVESCTYAVLQRIKTSPHTGHCPWGCARLAERKFARAGELALRLDIGKALAASQCAARASAFWGGI